MQLFLGQGSLPEAHEYILSDGFTVLFIDNNLNLELHDCSPVMESNPGERFWFLSHVREGLLQQLIDD
jgi:hypothetical protein